jgi:hypothetical protein
MHEPREGGCSQARAAPPNRLRLRSPPRRPDPITAVQSAAAVDAAVSPSDQEDRVTRRTEIAAVILLCTLLFTRERKPRQAGELALCGARRCPFSAASGIPRRVPNAHTRRCVQARAKARSSVRAGTTAAARARMR